MCKLYMTSDLYIFFFADFFFWDFFFFLQIFFFGGGGGVGVDLKGIHDVPQEINFTSLMKPDFYYDTFM